MKETEIMQRYHNPAYRGDVRVFAQQNSKLLGNMVVSASGDNPFCGDTLKMALSISNSGLRTVEGACYEGYGCSLCIASAEVLMEAIQGKTVDECLVIRVDELLDSLGGIVVGRTRMKCLELPLVVLKKALGNIEK